MLASQYANEQVGKLRALVYNHTKNQDESDQKKQRRKQNAEQILDEYPDKNRKLVCEMQETE